MSERIMAAAIALVGLVAIAMNKRFARMSIISSREYFGIELPEGIRRYRFTIVYSRTIAIIVGLFMFVLGTLEALGIDWRAVYQ